MASIKPALLGASLAVLSAAAAATSTTPPTERVLIGTNRVEATGCNSSSERFTTHVPNVERLDRTYKGALDGIEIERVTGHGEISNITFSPDGRNITYQLTAKGDGFRVNAPPKELTFGLQLGNGLCAGAKGAWIEVRVFAIYAKTPR